MRGKLIVLGNHIGSPDDVSINFLEIIKKNKNIACENPEMIMDKSKNIIQIGFDERDENVDVIMKLLYDGEDVVLLSDEGMPGIADPGGAVLSLCIKNNIEIKTTAGPSTIIAAAVVTNILNRFMFHGFLPKEEKWAIEFLRRVVNLQSPHIFLLENIVPGGNTFSQEAIDTIKRFEMVFGGERRATLCFNLTAGDQEIFKGTIAECLKFMMGPKRPFKNACIVIDDYEGIYL